ncbi:MAG TPA: tetratricopeptide repeat protein [Vicinamibacterales bacterium]|nr:tetratricopeptide repeat protein [Vicinamibacterales bacterium]
MTFKPVAAVVVIASLAGSAACSKPDADAMVAKGNEFVKNNLLPEAIVQYKMAVQAEPKRGDIRSKLSDAYLQHREGASALREAVNAADLMPTDASAQIKAGNLLLMAGAFEDARARGQKALAIDGTRADALILIGNALAGLKDLDGAISQYQDALVLNPAGDQAYANIGAIQYARGQRKEAEATFRKAIEAAPKAASSHLALANFLWASDRLPEAETELKAALALEPNNITANRSLGLYYLANGRAAEAEPLFKAIVAALKTDEAEVALADYYLLQKRFDEAKTILTPLAKKADAFASASLRLALIEASQNNRPGARAIVRTVLDKQPHYAPARLFDTRLLVLDNKLDEAMTSAQSLAKDEPNSSAGAEANYIIGTIEAGRDRTVEAQKALEEALRISPGSVVTTFALGQLHLRIGNPDKAESYARQVLSVKPGDPGARALIVGAELMRNDQGKANADLATLEREYPNNTVVMTLVAARELSAGRYDAARTAYTKVTAKDPDSLEALEGLLLLDLRAGKKKDAAERADAALKRIKPSANLFVIAAKTYLALGEAKRAEDLLRQAIEREPARLAAYGMLGQLYIDQKRLGEAEEQFKEIVRRNPQSIAANTMLGMLHEAQGKLAEAEEQYQKTLGLDSSAAVAANNLAWILVSSDRSLEQAMQLAQTALKGLPEEPHVNDTMGWILYRKGRPEQAVRYLEAAVRRDSAEPLPYYHLGMAYSDMKDVAKARQALEKALQLSTAFPGAADARRALTALGR